MKKLWLHVLPLLIPSLLILLPIAARASSVVFSAIGQTSEPPAGDNRAARIDTPRPDPRFSNDRDGVVRDNLTGLIWSGDANPLSTRSSGADSRAEVTWRKALDEIKRLNADTYLGYDDWRLPNLNELASLVHQGAPVQSSWLGFQGFSNTAASRYWSSSSAAQDAARAWAVNMDGGSTGTLRKSGTALVWPVRGVSNTLPATGQVACYDTAGLQTECAGSGQDGELRMGISWPVPRFADNGNGTITDNLTGLVWPKNANPIMDAYIARTGAGSALWPDALEFVARLNTGMYLGYSDWRLPNRAEMVSLVNYAGTTPGVKLNMAGVDDLQDHYWSSDTSAANQSDAWNIFMTGEVVERGKYDPRFGSYIWPVRGVNAMLPASDDPEGAYTSAPASQAAAAAPLSVTTSTLPDGMVGTSYSQSLTATGGTTPYTWTRTTGSLPAGLTLSTTGVISGTPTTAGTGSFTVQVKDKSARTATKTLSIIIAAAPLTISTATLADGYLTTAYSQTVTATGGKSAYTWSISAGTLPAGLALAASTGIISGTPTATGTGSITVQVKDAANTIVSKPLTITVYALPSITTATLSAGVVGTAYSQTLSATGGKATSTWSISSGALPAGLTLAASTGVISGTPTTTGTSSVTFKITDANARSTTKALSITINPTPLTISTATLSDAYLTTAYNQTVTATGGKTAYTWSIITGTLPTGLTLAASTGIISGTPTAAGAASITVQVKDAANTIVSKPLTITVYALPSITTATLSAAGIGTAYSQTLTATGGKAACTWSVSSGTLPAGLTLAASTGVISGIPTTTGTSSVTFRITDANAKTATKALSITVSTTPPSITTTTLNNGTVAVSYSQTLTATGGKTPYSWSRTTGSLPASLSLSSAGVISGKPTAPGISTFTVQVKDGNNAVATKSLTITVTTPLSIDPTITYDYGTIGGGYSHTFLAANGVPPYAWSVTSGPLPAGLSLDSATGLFSGTLTGASEGNNAFVIQVTDSKGSTASETFIIYCYPELKISTNEAYDSYVESSYGIQLLSTGGQAPYTWTIISGSLPPGLTLDPALAKITGIANTAASSTFTVQVQDVYHAKATKTYTIKISSYASLSGIVTDQTTGAPLAGVAINLRLDYRNHNINDHLYLCNNVPLAAADYASVAANDDVRHVCKTAVGGNDNIMQFKVRNPVGAVDPFTVTWNGSASLESSYPEFLAQSFKPTRSGLLTKASFHIPHNLYGTMGILGGYIRVLLKSKPGGDRGNYLAISSNVPVTGYANITTPAWVDFTFPTPAAVIAGQDYYLEISGSYADVYATYYKYLYELVWDGSTYAGGSAYSKQGGIWVKASTPLAFRTYVDDQPDITTDTVANRNLYMYGGAATFASSSLGMVINTTTPDSEGDFGYSGDDLTGISSIFSDLSSYYDANGWLQFQLSSYLASHDLAVYLVTDQVSTTFNRTLTAVTDAGGAYSFPNLPDGTYTVVISKNPYDTVIAGGSLPAGQAASINTALAMNTDLRITTSTFSVGVIYMDYSKTLTVSGGKAPYRWSVVNGAIPYGMTLDSNTGVLSGRATTARSNFFVVQVQDANNKTALRAFTLTILETAVKPRMSVSPASISFGGVSIGNLFASVVTVTNVGSTDLVIGGATQPSEPFRTTSDTCSGKTLAASAVCTMTIQFAPTHTGSFYDIVDIPFNDENYPSVAVNLSGDGIVSYLLPDTGRGESVRNPIQYAVNSENSATDGNTRLMWQRNGSAAAMTWAEAGAYCKSLTLDGFNDWRLPGLLELTTIINYGTANPAVDSAVFAGTRSEKYWTTHEGMGNKNSSPTLYAGVVNFAYGEAYPQEKVASAFVRCTRGETLTNYLRTTGDRSSNSYPYANAPISTDQSTGLVWAGNPVACGFDPYVCDVLGSCTPLSSLNGCSMLEYAGIRGWRTPTIKELATLSSQPYFPNGCSILSATPSGRPDASGNLSNMYMFSPGSDILSAPASDYHNVACVSGGDTFNVKNTGDVGNVAVMVMAGDLATASQPRQKIAREYLSTHGDNVDFLVFLSTFEYALPGGAQGLYTGVKNDTQGINRPLFDNSGQFGSNGKLQGTIDLGNVTTLAAAPYGAKLDQTLIILGHELMHRFGPHVRFKDPDGVLNSALLGDGDTHWSYLLDSKGSLMYGNGWMDNGNGTFTSTSQQSGYSPLDLYLMGMIPKTQVPPMLLIENTNIDKTQLPHLGDTITGTAKTVTIDDIVAAEGERTPNAASSQKQFNIGFVLLTRTGDNATAATQAIEVLRKAWAGRFAELTQGKGSVANITASLQVAVDSPADGSVITGPDVTVSGTVINTGGAETGVTVNGMPAAVSGSRFIANHVPLVKGSNTITVTATDANGLTATATRSVTAQAGQYLRIASNVESGTAPLNLSFRLEGSFIIANPQISYTGPVSVTLTPGASSTEFTATLTAEGTYTFTASAVGPDGQTHSHNATITVLSKYQLETLLSGKWRGINDKIASGDIEGAVMYLTSTKQSYFRELFTALGSRLPQLAAESQPLEFVFATEDMAKGRVFQQETVQGNVVTVGYPVYFEREDGLWRLKKY
ncbi:MAG: putative Ig domain-containing protein [Desulfuromonadales bacterium]